MTRLEKLAIAMFVGFKYDVDLVGIWQQDHNLGYFFSTARRLASRGSGFKASNEVAAAIAGGVATKLTDALMAALGPRFESLSSKDVIAIFELYEATPSVLVMAKAVKMPEASDLVAKQ